MNQPIDFFRGGPLAALQAAFAAIGDAPRADEDLEVDGEKVALFIDGSGEYTHAARQLPDGLWTSKLGNNEDISHELRPLEGDEYGRIAAFMSKRRQSRFPLSSGRLQTNYNLRTRV